MREQNEKQLFDRALALACEKHAGQTRKDGTEYIHHPVRVAKMIREAGYGINYQIAGLFHDLLEDTDITEEEILFFGADVLEAVKLVSKNYCTDPIRYIEKILENHMALVVKNADRIDNLREACYSEDPVFQKRYLKDSKEKYEGKFSVELDECIRSLEEKLCEKQKL